MFALITPPVQEPIPIADLKSALRVGTDLDDTLLTQMAVTARTFIERRLDHAILAQTWSLTLTGRAPEQVVLRPSLVTAVTSVTARYGTGGADEVPADQWCLTHRLPARLTLDVPNSQGGEALAELVITFTAGRADPATVPADLLQAIYLLTAHYYEEREMFRQQRYVSVPHGVQALLEGLREVQL